MSDELGIVVTQPVVVPPVSAEPVATGEVKPEGTVNLPPDAEVLQTEIDRLKQVREKAEEDTRYWRKQKAEARGDYFKGRQEPIPLPVEKRDDLGIGPEPKQEIFDDYQKYLDAKISYEVNKAKVTWDREEVEKQTDTQRQQKMTDLKERINLGYQEYNDFEEVALSPEVPITPIIAEILADCEIPHRIAYYLGKNRAEAIRISRLSPIQATREIAKIEVEITKAINQPPVTPKIPSAPAPIKPLGSSHTIQKSPEKMTQKEYEAWANQNPGLRRF